jgi:hypothetical protein
VSAAKTVLRSFIITVIIIRAPALGNKHK